MKNISPIIFVILIFLATSLTAQTWVYQPTKSQITWTGKAAFSAYSLSGTLQLKTANIQVIDNDIQTGQFVFDMKSMDGEIKDLIKHLKSKDFFEVKKYKTAVFKLEQLSSTTPSIAKGQLIIKNKRNPVEMEVKIQMSGDQIIVKGKAIVNRTDFGITYNSPSFFEKMKDQAVADDFELDFTLSFGKN